MKYDHKEFLCKDTCNELTGISMLLYRKVYVFLSTLCMKVVLRLQGVKYGKNVVFRGLSLVNRFPTSSIVIGNNCRFNSSNLFNYRGLNHSCIIQTGTPDAKIIIGDKCGFSG